jgi:hypothetical protein
MASQLCKVFDCNNQQLKASGILDTFNEWLKGQPEIWVSHSFEHGEAINGNIADKLYKFYRNKKANQVFGLVLWHWLAAIDPFLPVALLQTGQSAKSRFCELECYKAAFGDFTLPARSGRPRMAAVR